MKRLIVALALLASPAGAQDNCIALQDFLDSTREQGARLVFMGEAQGVGTLNVYVHDDGSWIAVNVWSDAGVACLAGMGSFYHIFDPASGKDA